MALAVSAAPGRLVPRWPGSPGSPGSLEHLHQAPAIAQRLGNLCINLSKCMMYMCGIYIVLSIFIYLLFGHSSIIYQFICLLYYVFLHLWIHLSIYLSIYLPKYVHDYTCISIFKIWPKEHLKKEPQVSLLWSWLLVGLTVNKPSDAHVYVYIYTYVYIHIYMHRNMYSPSTTATSFA